MPNRRILIVTGSRADSSPLMPLIQELRARHDVSTHTMETFGLFGHEENLRLSMKAYRPDMVVLLGDRYETLVAASVAHLLGIPIAHLCGGDITLGAVDDGFRHAITKLAYWHFPMCARHAERIEQMGETYERIFTIGSPGVDLLMTPPMSIMELEKELGHRIRSPLTLVCYHPETATKRSIDEQLVNLTARFTHEGTIVISGANNDPGGEAINEWLCHWALWNNQVFRKSYSQLTWLSLMYHADTLIGNSSGFIVEGMTMRQELDHRPNRPEIIIVGDRQRGRYEEAQSMFFPNVTPGAINYIHPFGKPGTVSKRIAEILATVPIPETTQKVFHDR